MNHGKGASFRVQVIIMESILEDRKEEESDLDGWLEKCELKCVEDFGEDEWRKMRKGETYFI